MKTWHAVAAVAAVAVIILVVLAERPVPGQPFPPARLAQARADRVVAREKAQQTLLSRPARPKTTLMATAPVPGLPEGLPDTEAAREYFYERARLGDASWDIMDWKVRMYAHMQKCLGGKPELLEYAVQWKIEDERALPLSFYVDRSDRKVSDEYAAAWGKCFEPFFFDLASSPELPGITIEEQTWHTVFVAPVGTDPLYAALAEMEQQ